MNWRDDHDLFVSASSDPTSHFCRRFLDDHVQHDGGGGSQGVPCKDVLGVVVPQADLSWPSEGDTSGFVVDHLHELGFCVSC
jgi:hypothetical protein